MSPPVAEPTKGDFGHAHFPLHAIEIHNNLASKLGLGHRGGVPSTFGPAFRITALTGFPARGRRGAALSDRIVSERMARWSLAHRRPSLRTRGLHLAASISDATLSLRSASTSAKV